MKSTILCFFSVFSVACLAAGADSGNPSVKPPKIATIIFQDDQFFRLIEFGAREAAQKAGATSVEGNSDNKLDKERQLVDAFVTSKADAIIISPLHRKARFYFSRNSQMAKQGLMICPKRNPRLVPA